MGIIAGIIKVIKSLI
ncbi:alpha family phenol-soluble modulin [Staphylococcus aureus]